MNAAQKVFKGIQLYGCFFHLNQNIWRRIQNFSLEAAYNDLDSKVNYRKLLKMLVVLCYIPTDDVIELFEKISATLDLSDALQAQIKVIYDYFEETYIGKNRVVKSGRGRSAKSTIVRAKPKYDISFWSIHKRLVKDLPRTTNSVESWHNSFGNTLKSHPIVYDLIEALRKEDKRNSDILIKLQTGVTFNKNCEFVKTENRIREILKSYTKEKLDDFFNRLSLVINY
jgi:hypothetical protein